MGQNRQGEIEGQSKVPSVIDRIDEYIDAEGPLPRHEVEQAERYLRLRPNDVLLRARLLLFYSLDADLEFWEHRARHVFWFIQNLPTNRFSGSSYCDLTCESDAIFYKASRLWLKQLERHPEDAVVAENAINYHLVHEPELAVKLAEAQKKRNPLQPLWRRMLTWLYSTLGERDGEYHQKAFKEANAALDLEQPNADTAYAVLEIAAQARQAGRREEARKLCTRLLEIHPALEVWDGNNVKHKAHTLLGLLALEGGDVESAEQHLLDAAAVTDSPQLASQGPQTELAAALLQKGRRATVLQYLERCSDFWYSGSDRLAARRQEIEGGSIPF